MATVAEEAASVSVGEGELSSEEKLKLMLSTGGNNKCIPEDDDFADLRNMLAKKKDPVCYDGFEPSGRMHIAQGIMKVSPQHSEKNYQMLHHHGRTEAEDMSVGQIFYPCMQCADIFFIKTDICQLGNCHLRKLKPIILSHHMLPGLLAGQEKMSKSDPNSAIYMEDDEEIAGNPCMEYN
uniref:tyrosine--tRNA ligase n=1 Tax=Physcomitrium patens TaxID=3218 RepID=A0A7I4FRD5_PHYPA